MSEYPSRALFPHVATPWDNSLPDTQSVQNPNQKILIGFVSTVRERKYCKSTLPCRKKAPSSF